MIRAGLLIALSSTMMLAQASLARSHSAFNAFRSVHACPATERHRGPCPGYQVDHIVALCAGGDDKPANMQWLTVEAHKLKTRGDVAVCRFMRKTKP